MRSVLGVDVGGTKVAVGPVDRTGAQLAPPLFDSSRAVGTAAFINGLETTLRNALEDFSEFEPEAIGLACAGTVDHEHGLVLSSPNLPLKDVALAGMLEKSLGIPVVLENDANAAILGEVVTGAAAGLRHVVMLTLGTGVGGALFLDGRLYRGASGGAGELGHVVVQADGLPCRCGNRGCLEMYASGSAMGRFAEVRAGDPETDPTGALSKLREHDRLTGREVSRLAREGDVGALGVVQELAGWLGIGLVGLTHIFDPEMIVVGGGVGELGELILGPAREFVRENAMSPGRDRVQIASAKLGNKAGLVGGGLAAWEVLG